MKIIIALTILFIFNGCFFYEDMSPKDCRKAGGIYKKVKTHNFLTGKDEYQSKCIKK